MCLQVTLSSGYVIAQFTLEIFRPWTSFFLGFDTICLFIFNFFCWGFFSNFSNRCGCVSFFVCFLNNVAFFTLNFFFYGAYFITPKSRIILRQDSTESIKFENLSEIIPKLIKENWDIFKCIPRLSLLSKYYEWK